MCAVRYTKDVQHKNRLQVKYNGRQDYNKRMPWGKGKGVVGKQDQSNSSCTDFGRNL